MVKKKSWKDFRETGLLFFINQILHAFGWAIVIDVKWDESIDVYPARVKFRGFGEDAVERGYSNIGKYLIEHGEEIGREAIGPSIIKEVSESGNDKKTFSLDEVAKIAFYLTDTTPCGLDDHLSCLTKFNKDFKCPFGRCIETKGTITEKDKYDEKAINCWKHIIGNGWLEKAIEYEKLRRGKKIKKWTML